MKISSEAFTWNC